MTLYWLTFKLPFLTNIITPDRNISDQLILIYQTNMVSLTGILSSILNLLVIFFVLCTDE